jgi:hypothetical protein
MSLGITRESIMYNGAAYRGTVSTVKPLPSAYDLEKMRWEGVTGLYHPDDVNSSIPISCMKTNPNWQFVTIQSCKGNQAFLDQQAALGYKTTFPIDSPVVELTDRNGKITPIVVGDKTENLAPLVMLAGLAALLFMGG